MGERAPVTDWAQDFDHLDPAWIDDPFPIWDGMRSNACPVAHTKRFDGVYFPSTWDTVREVSYDTEHFSSYYVIVRENREKDAVGGMAPPITSDPPQHRADRMILLPPFTPKNIDKLIPQARMVCNRLIDRFIDRGHCDGSADYAKHIPTLIIAHMLGLPDEDGEQFRIWIQEILEIGIVRPDVMKRATDELTAYLYAALQARRARRGDDLISYLIDAEFQGRKMEDPQILGSLRLLLVAGIDTTWSAIGASLWHLATHPQDQKRLREEPELMRTAIEELLRAYSPVTMARLVKKETTIAGCPFKSGEMVLLSFPAANRDPQKFPDADKVILDREENPHAAFGLGIHRCIGSNLARMEMTVAIEEMLRRIPDFRYDETKPMRWSEGTVRGPRVLPLLFP
jgi:cytochrome P450